MEQWSRKLCCNDLWNRLSVFSRSLRKSLMSENIKRTCVLGSRLSEVPICSVLSLSTYQRWRGDPLIICQVSKPLSFWLEATPTNQSDMALIRVVSLQGIKRELALEALSRDGWLVISKGSGNLAKPHLELHAKHTDAAGLGSSNQGGHSLKP